MREWNPGRRFAWLANLMAFWLFVLALGAYGFWFLRVTERTSDEIAAFVSAPRVGDLVVIVLSTLGLPLAQSGVALLLRWREEGSAGWPRIGWQRGMRSRAAARDAGSSRRRPRAALRAAIARRGMRAHARSHRSTRCSKRSFPAGTSANARSIVPMNFTVPPSSQSKCVAHDSSRSKTCVA